MDDLPLEEIQAFEEMIGKDQANMPSRKEMLDILAESNFTDEAKEKIKSLLVGDVPAVFGSGSGGLLAFVFVFIIFGIILFFGYKLYKSIKEKEIKREEKKKAKMSKKKK